jgi:hypothetical protein
VRRPRRSRHLVYALYANAAVLLCIFLVLLTRGGPAQTPAFGAPIPSQAIAGGGSLYLMPAQFTPNNWGCYVLDIDTQVLCAYRYLPANEGTGLRLVAARKITYDRRLNNFNSDHPSWEEVKDMVEREQQSIRGAQQPEPSTKGSDHQ